MEQGSTQRNDPFGGRDLGIVSVRLVPTTSDRLVDDLRASLTARTGVAAGLTWGDFKAAMAQLGVQDSDPLASIDYGCSRLGGNGVIVRDDATGGVEIREGR